MPEVDLVVGNSSKRELARLVAGRLDAGPERAPDTDVAVRSLTGEAFEAYDIARFRGYTRAFIKIQDGCDHRCAYCAVPDARGPARSRSFDDVLHQASLLADNGYREIVLTGVHIGGFEDDTGHKLPELLSALAGIEGLVRLRLGSVEPTRTHPGARDHHPDDREGLQPPPHPAPERLRRGAGENEARIHARPVCRDHPQGDRR